MRAKVAPHNDSFAMTAPLFPDSCLYIQPLVGGVQTEDRQSEKVRHGVFHFSGSLFVHRALGRCMYIKPLFVDCNIKALLVVCI
jgi:hypothetical protein